MTPEKRREIGRKGGSAITKGTKLRGFASMSPERRREVGATGGSRSRNPWGRKGKPNETKKDQ